MTALTELHASDLCPSGVPALTLLSSAPQGPRAQRGGLSLELTGTRIAGRDWFDRGPRVLVGGTDCPT